jgi:hypothetical protein
MMISIFNHIYGCDGVFEANTEAAVSAALRQLSIGLLESVSRNVLVGQGLDPLRHQLDEIRGSLPGVESAEQLSQVKSAMSNVLDQYQSTVQQAAAAQAVEVQHIFAMLNHALIVMAEGRDRSVSRLGEIQTRLEQTSMMRDIVALKSALANTVNFVEQEALEARTLVSEELTRLETEVGEAREFLGRTRTELAGRQEGVVRIGEAIQNLHGGEAVYGVAYVCDRLKAIARRYGSLVAEELVFRVIRERLQPIADIANVYRWTSLGLVAVLSRQRDLGALQTEVAVLNRAPVVHRVALGNRTATLTMVPSRLVVEGCDGAPALVEQLDRFTSALA